jgi:hypothetical protein
MRRLPSFPEIPTARVPQFAMRETIPSLIFPTSTIWAISSVSGSVIRRPPTNFGSLPIAFILAVISGPPPWTRTTFIPT